MPAQPQDLKTRVKRVHSSTRPYGCRAEVFVDGSRLAHKNFYGVDGVATRIRAIDWVHAEARRLATHRSSKWLTVGETMVSERDRVNSGE